jgi:transcriptional regulator with XRE-family HTH domain
MTSRRRAADLGADAARRAALDAGTELRITRQAGGLSQATVARAAGMSPAQLARLERGRISRPTVDQLFRAGLALGLDASLRYFPAGSPVRDAGQIALLGRFETLLAPPLSMRREVALPINEDLRAWDGVLLGDVRRAFVEGEARLGDVQAVARRVDLKLRDDPRGEVVILVLTRSRHNRRVLDEHRETLRAQFPLDGAAIARALRSGRVPAASGIILL